MKGDFTITKEVTSGGYNMPYSHMHNSFEISLLISGDRTVIIDDEKHKVAAGDVTLFDKNIPHRSYGDAPYSGICIKFKDYYLNLYFTPLAKQELLSCFEYPVIKLNAEQITYISAIADSFDETSQYNFAILANILSMLPYRSFPLKAQKKPLRSPSSLFPMLTTIIQQFQIFLSSLSCLTFQKAIYTRYSRQNSTRHQTSTFIT